MDDEYKIRWWKANRRMYQGAANIAGLKLAQWIRMVLDREARKVAEEQGRDE